MIQNNRNDSKPSVYQISSQCETAVYQSFLFRLRSGAGKSQCDSSHSHLHPWTENQRIRSFRCGDLPTCRSPFSTLFTSNHANLLVQFQEIEVVPTLNDFAISNADDRHTRNFNRFVCCGKSKVITFVAACYMASHCHLVSFDQ